MIERVEVDEKRLAALVIALNAEADGKALTRDLVVALKAVAEVGAQAARTSILTMSSPNETTQGLSLRAAVAGKVETHVRLTGAHPGVWIRAHKTGMPRGFVNAPKRLNARRGWRHLVYGRQDSWIRQIGKPDWFDGTLRRHRAAARRAADRALDNVAERISARTKG